MSMSSVSRRWAYGLLGLGTCSYTCLMFTWFSLPAYLPEITAELGLSGTEAGILTGAIPLTYVPISLFSGVIIDRIGPFRGIGIGVVLFGASQLFRAGAVTFPVLLALTVIIGVGGTTITFGMPKLVSELFPAEESGTPSSVYLLGAFAGTSSAFGIGRPILGPMLGGWRPLLFWNGVIVLCFAVIWWTAIWFSPVGSQRTESGTTEEEGQDGRRGEAETQEFSLDSIRKDIRTVFASQGMRLLVILGVVYLSLMHGLQNWLATLLQSSGVSPTVAATITGGFVIAQAAGTIVIPPLSDRLQERSGMVMLCGGLGAIGMVLLMLPGTAVGLAVIAVGAVGLCAGGLSPLVRVIPLELEEIGPALTGTAIGLIFTFGELGGFFGPFLIGALRDVTGSFVPGLAVLFLGCLFAVDVGRRLDV